MFDVFINIIETIFGGLLITLLLFILNEYVFKKINLSGEWITTFEILKTSYKPFENLKIQYRIHLLQKGYEISGTGEKIKDIHPNGSEEIFEREKRIVINVEGYYERKYLAKSKLYLIITEKGINRETRTSCIICINKKILKGKFSWTAADAVGEIIMSKQ